MQTPAWLPIGWSRALRIKVRMLALRPVCSSCNTDESRLPASILCTSPWMSSGETLCSKQQRQDKSHAALRGGERQAALMACHATSAPTHVGCGSRPSAWHGGLQWSAALTGLVWSAAQRYHALADGQPWEQGHPCWQTPPAPAQMPPCSGACMAVLAQGLTSWQSWPASHADFHCCRPACLPALERALLVAWLGPARLPVHAFASCCRSQDL